RFGKLVLHAMKQILVPIEGDVIFLEFLRRGSEIDVTDFTRATGMSADGDHHVLSSPGRGASVGFDSHVIAQRSALENVVPGNDMKSGNVDVGEVIFNGPAFPVVVVVRVGKPIQKIGSDGLGQAVSNLD